LELAALRKAVAITDHRVIEKFALHDASRRFSLQLSESIGLYRVTNPGKNGSNHLLPPHGETIHLSPANPDGMSFKPAANPGQFSWPGFLFWATCLFGRRFSQTGSG
jgi:hypothetical protein